MSTERLYTWKLELRSGSAEVRATPEVLLKLAECSEIVQIKPCLGPDDRFAPEPACAICGRLLFFVVGWVHHSRNGNPFQWHTDPEGKAFLDSADHRAVPVFQSE